MSARLLPLALLLTASWVSAAAQTPVQYAAHLAPIAADTFAPALHVYAGRYATDGGEVEVVVQAGRLAVIAHGAPVAAALASAPPAATDHVLLAAWAAGDLGPALAAVAPADRADAAVDLAAARDALVRAWGAVRAARPVGTFERTDGRRVTLARVAFERGAEWLSLVWDETGALATITRGLGAADLGTARPAGRDTFVLDGAELRFTRDADGRVSGIDVSGRLTARR